MYNEATLEHSEHRPVFADLPTGQFGGRGLRHPRPRDRSQLDAFTRAGTVEPVAGIAHFHALVRDADAMHPEVISALRDRMARLQHRWESLQPDDQVCVADWIESICLPWVEVRVPLRGNGLEPTWAHDFLLSLLRDFDASGQLIEFVDAAGRKPTRSATSVTTITRLAGAAGWLAWSHLIVDPAMSAATLTLMSELLDRLDRLSGSRAAGFSPADRGWTLAGLALEERLLRHWHPGPSRAH